MSLQAHGIYVSVLNPAQVSYFVQSQPRRNKTDQADALCLAIYAQERQPAATAHMELSRPSLAREIQSLSKQITRLKNRLAAARHGQVHSKVITSMKRRINTLEEKRGLEEELEQETRQGHEQQLDWLLSMPGMGVRSACLLLAELGDLARFATARKGVAYAGLTPTQFESGSSVNKRSHSSRLDSARLRHSLSMPCLAALRFNPISQGFFAHLVERSKHKKAALLACMTKLLRMVFGVLTHQKPFDPTLLKA